MPALTLALTHTRTRIHIRIRFGVRTVEIWLCHGKSTTATRRLLRVLRALSELLWRRQQQSAVVVVVAAACN